MTCAAVQELVLSISKPGHRRPVPTIVGLALRAPRNHFMISCHSSLSHWTLQLQHFLTGKLFLMLAICQKTPQLCYLPYCTLVIIGPPGNRSLVVYCATGGRSTAVLRRAGRTASLFCEGGPGSSAPVLLIPDLHTAQPAARLVTPAPARPNQCHTPCLPLNLGIIAISMKFSLYVEHNYKLLVNQTKCENHQITIKTPCT